jgi:radical SAM protein with 4Fe4S-binding SPASM domain
MPPRSIEISVYGVTQATYERVTRKPGSYAAFRRGLNRLIQAGIPFQLKTMALRSNYSELPAIASFCRQYSSRSFRFDPFLQLRCDGNPHRNTEIKSERLSPTQVVQLEQSDPERSQALKKNCDKLVFYEGRETSDYIITCGAGTSSFSVSWDGYFRLCSSLVEPASIYDLRQGSLHHAWTSFVPQVRSRRSTRPEFMENCASCPIVNLCQWCPAVAHLEVDQLDGCSEYFCQVARERAASLKKEK